MKILGSRKNSVIWGATRANSTHKGGTNGWNLSLIFSYKSYSKSKSCQDLSSSNYYCLRSISWESNLDPSDGTPLNTLKKQCEPTLVWNSLKSQPCNKNMTSDIVDVMSMFAAYPALGQPNSAELQLGCFNKQRLQSKNERLVKHGKILCKGIPWINQPSRGVAPSEVSFTNT